LVCEEEEAKIGLQDELQTPHGGFLNNKEDKTAAVVRGRCPFKV
jgi:hypothetical protein